MLLATAERQIKLEALRGAEDFDTVDAMLEAAAIDSVSPAICIHCNHFSDMEPDKDRAATATTAAATRWSRPWSSPA